MFKKFTRSLILTCSPDTWRSFIIFYTGHENGVWRSSMVTLSHSGVGHSRCSRLCGLVLLSYSLCRNVTECEYMIENEQMMCCEQIQIWTGIDVWLWTGILLNTIQYSLQWDDFFASVSDQMTNYTNHRHYYWNNIQICLDKHFICLLWVILAWYIACNVEMSVSIMRWYLCHHTALIHTVTLLHSYSLFYFRFGFNSCTNWNPLKLKLC